MVQGNTVKLDIDITESDSWDKFLEVMNNHAGTFDDFIQMVKLHGTFDATNPALVQATMDRVDTYVQELEQKWGIKMEDVNLHVKQGQYVFEQGGRTHRPPDPDTEEDTKDTPKFQDILSEGVTKMLPGGGIVEAFKSMGAIPAIAVGVVGILGFVKKMFEHSQILNTYSNAFMKIFGHFADLIMIAFLPLLNSVLIWLITKVRPIIASFSEWLGNNQGIAAALGAVLIGLGISKTLRGLILSGVMRGMGWLLARIGIAATGNIGGSIYGRTTGGGRGGLGRVGMFGLATAGVGAAAYLGWQAFDDNRSGLFDYWGEDKEEEGPDIVDNVGLTDEEMWNRIVEENRHYLSEAGEEEVDIETQNSFQEMLGDLQKQITEMVGDWLEPSSVALASEASSDFTGEGEGLPLGYGFQDTDTESIYGGPPNNIPSIAGIENVHNAFNAGNNTQADYTSITQDGSDISVQQHFNTNIYVTGDNVDDSVVQYTLDNVYGGVTRGIVGGSSDG